MRRSASLLPLILAACAQPIDPPVVEMPRAARDGGIGDLPTEDGPTLDEPLLFHGITRSYRFEFLPFEQNGIGPSTTLLPSRGSALGLDEGSFSIRAVTPDGRRAFAIHTGIAATKLYAIDLVQRSETPVELGEVVEGLVSGFHEVSNTFATFSDIDGLKIVRLSGDEPATLIGSHQVRRVVLMEEHVITEEGGEIWVRHIDRLDDPFPLALFEGGSASIVFPIGGDRLLFSQSGAYVATPVRAFNATAVASSDDCIEPIVAIDNQLVCSIPEQARARRLVTFRLSGEDFGTEGSVLVGRVNDVRRWTAAPNTGRIWVETSSTVLVVRADGPTAGDVTTVQADLYVPRVTSVAEDGRTALVQTAEQIALVLHADRPASLRKRGVGSVQLDPSGRWVGFQDYRTGATFAFDTVQSSTTTVQTVGPTPWITRRGFFSFEASNLERIVRMSTWGVEDVVLPWGRVRGALTNTPRGVVMTRGFEDALWLVPYESGPPVRFATQPGRIIGFNDDYLLTSHQQRVGEAQVFTFDPSPDFRERHDLDFRSRNLVLGEHHIFAFGRGAPVEVAGLAVGDGRIRTIYEPETLDAKWHPGAKKLITIVNARFVAIDPSGTTHSSTHAISTSGPFIEYSVFETNTNALVRSPARIYDVAGDAPPRSPPLTNPRVAREPFVGETHVLLTADEGLYLWRMADEQVTLIDRNVEARFSLISSRDEKRHVITIGTRSRYFELADEIVMVDLPDRIIPRAFTGDGRGILHGVELDNRLSLYDLDRGWSRVITNTGVPINAVLSIKASVPIVQSVVDGNTNYYGVMRNGRLEPLTAVDDARDTLLLPPR